MADQTDRVALSAPKGIVALVLTALLSGGVGVTASGLAAKPEPGPPAITRVEVEQIATAKADIAANAAREDCRRELAGSMAVVTASLNRIENAVGKLAGDVEQLKVDVADLKARRR